jgi:glycosyltransferase involved in cell wall biosynthesis
VKKVLVISYTFPPVEGIGGRRWAKFAKYFLRNDVDVQVLTAKLPEGVSEWNDDIHELKKQNRIHYFNTLYPTVLVEKPKTLLDKILYRASLYYVKTKIKGNFYDKSALCKSPFLDAVRSFVKKGYNNIILSVGPFYYSSFLADLKSEFPNLNLILDVRDPWTNNKTSFGYATLDANRYEVEKTAERKAAQHYDHIVSVADDMGTFFINEYNVPENKIITIKNGFDTEDIPPVNMSANARKSIVFTGNLYEKALASFLMLYNQLQQLKEKDPEIFHKYEFHFYGEIHPSMKYYFMDELNLFFHNKIPLKEVYEKISNASACLLFLTDDLNYSFSTKFYEYLSLKKPILVFSKPGKTGEFVEGHQIGKQMDEHNLPEVLKSLDASNYYDRPVDIGAFDVKNLAKDYLTLIH